MAPIKVLLCKDNADSGDGLNALLKISKGFNVVGVFYHSEAILSEIIVLQPEVIIIDVELPVNLSIECTRRVKDKFPNIHILFYTIYEDEDKLFGALRAGASGYLLKRSSAGLLREAILEVMQGGSPMSPCIARKVIQHFHQHGNSAKYTLCDRERNILRFLVKGLPTKIISGKVFLSEDGVKKNLRNIYNKLKVNSGKEAVAKAVRERII